MKICWFIIFYIFLLNPMDESNKLDAECQTESDPEFEEILKKAEEEMDELKKQNLDDQINTVIESLYVSCLGSVCRMRKLLDLVKKYQ